MMMDTDRPITQPPAGAATDTDTGRITSEVAPLRTVIVHRPGAELTRITPRNTHRLLFDAVPWLAGAQTEHDIFTDTMRAKGVEVLYVSDLLTTCLSDPDARTQAIDDAASAPWMGTTLAARTRAYLNDLDPEQLTATLIAGLRMDELFTLRPESTKSLVAQISSSHEFVVSPLPNTFFTRDSAFWIGNRVAVSSLARQARDRESSLTALVYTYHPRFAGTAQLYDPTLEPLEGGDVLVMGDGVVAVGTGERTTPAGVETLARRLFQSGMAHTVLAVPISPERATMHLDTICTMVDYDAMVVYPGMADELFAYTVTNEHGPEHVSDPQPFLAAAAQALQFDRIRTIDIDLDPIVAEREQWDDAFNTLALAPGQVITYERNHAVNQLLEQAGVDVLPIPGSQLGAGRGGPRCMSCPVVRG